MSLSKKEMGIFDSLRLDNHALVSIDKIYVTPESAELRERFNSGGSLALSEILAMPYIESEAEVKIIDKNDLTSLASICRRHGVDLQSLFGNDSFQYQSLFINSVGLNHEISSLLVKYGLRDYLVDNKKVELCISFPEIEKNVAFSIFNDLLKDKEDFYETGDLYKISMYEYMLDRVMGH